MAPSERHFFRAETETGRIDGDFADGIEDLVQISNWRRIETDGKRTDEYRGLGVLKKLYLLNGESDQKCARNKRDVEFHFLYGMCHQIECIYNHYHFIPIPKKDT